MPPLSTAYNWRATPAAGDGGAVASLLEATGLFTPAEIRLGAALLDEQPGAGYEYWFCEHDGMLRGYSCFGRIPGTDSSYDLYWIAVDPDHQGCGVGKAILAMTETAIMKQGGTRMYIDTSSRAEYFATRQFYHAAGYRVAAELPDFYRPGDGKTIFCKILAVD